MFFTVIGLVAGLLLAEIRVEASQMDNGYGPSRVGRPRNLFGFDDDRHTLNATEEDAENSEILEYTTVPSSAPSRDPCKNTGGTFGDTDDGVPKTVVTFTYGVVTNKTVAEELNATLSDQLEDAENTMLDLAIASIFADCKDSSRRFLRENIFSEKIQLNLKVDSERNEAEDTGVVGLSSSPTDRPNGNKCGGAIGDDVECNVIEGRMDVFLTDDSYANDVTMKMSETIESMMNDGLLDGCHPAIKSVQFMQGPHNMVVTTRGTDDIIEVNDIEPISPTGGGMTWAIVAGVVAGLVALATGGRYMQTRNQQQNTADDEESFEEIAVANIPQDVV